MELIDNVNKTLKDDLAVTIHNDSKVSIAAQMEQQTLFTSTDNIKEDRTPEDLLFQVMLDLGVLLSSKIEEKVIAGKKVFRDGESSSTGETLLCSI